MSHISSFGNERWSTSTPTYNHNRLASSRITRHPGLSAVPDGLCCLQPAPCYVRMLRFLDYVCLCLLFRAPQCSLLIHSSCQPLHAVRESRRPICPSLSCAQIVASSVCASLHFRLRTLFTFRTLPYNTMTLGINSSACTALSTLGTTSHILALRLTSVLGCNAANFSGVTQGCGGR